MERISEIFWFILPCVVDVLLSSESIVAKVNLLLEIAGDIVLLEDIEELEIIFVVVKRSCEVVVNVDIEDVGSLTVEVILKSSDVVMDV